MIEKKTKYSDILNREVDIYIRLPKKFDQSKSYNVLYMHDGQNLFLKEDSSFGMIWDVDTILTKMENEGYEELIVVGVSSNKSHNGYLRLAEYSYYDGLKVKTWIEESNNHEDLVILEDDVLKARGTMYEEYLLNDLFKEIENAYNINKRYMMGSSMGGLYTLAFTLRNPGVLTKGYCVSNAFHYNLDGVLNECKHTDTLLYLDTGTDEASQGGADNLLYIDCNKQVYDKLVGHNCSIVFKTIEGAVHNELAWAERLEDILRSI